MNQDLQTALLTTVNAPYQTYLDAGEMATALNTGDIANAQMSSFFTETSVADQLTFAERNGVSEETLIATATAFAIWSGQVLPVLA